MAHPKNKGDRLHHRKTHGMRRIREDRAQHGRDHSCPCFTDDGYTLSMFANTPHRCSNPICCGNPRRLGGSENGPTMQEKRAATKKDWE